MKGPCLGKTIRFVTLARRFIVSAIVLLGGMLLPTQAGAWEAHWAITRSAVAALPADCQLRKLLGDEIGSMIDTYSMNPDYEDRLMRVKGPSDSWYYANDYLLFPGVRYHIRHEMPDVSATWQPYFSRALQALRTENSFNAARWIGSLLHFVQDTGAPSHAYHYKDKRPGDQSLMEGLINPEKVWIPDYKPVLLDSGEGLLRRMQGLMEYSARRAVGMVKLAHANNTAALEPLEDEVAQECARVSADVLYTLGELTKDRGFTTGGTLVGTVVSDSAPGAEGITAKVVVKDDFSSTLASRDGKFTFTDLPWRFVSLTISRPGSEPRTWMVEIKDDAVVRKESGKCQLWTFDGDAFRQLSDPAALTLSTDKWHTVTIRRSADKMELWVDGSFVREYQDHNLPPSPGRIGLGGHGFLVNGLGVFAVP